MRRSRSDLECTEPLEPAVRTALPASAVSMKLSVVIPVFNEKNTIVEIIDRVINVDLPKEIIVVDDGSTDGTRAILEELKPRIDQLIFMERNSGKGAAVKAGFAAATGDILVIQDADLEYDPADYH